MTPIRQLDAGARAAIVAHLLALTPRDRQLRFGASLGPEAIAAYVDGIDFARDAVFAAQDTDLIGVAHLALSGQVAEVGLSVLPAHRGRGVGSALFARVATRARNRSMRALLVRCLHGNAPMIRLARRFGMDIVRTGGETEGRLELPPLTLASVAAELLGDALAPREPVVGAATQARRAAHAAPRVLLAGQDGTH